MSNLNSKNTQPSKKKNSKELSEKEILKLAKKIKAGTIDEQDKALLERQILISQDVLKTVRESLQTVAKGIDNAGAEGKILLETIQRCVDIINEISKQGSQSDDLAKELSDKIIKIAGILRDINKENKSFWLKLVGMILAFVTFVTFIFGIIIFILSGGKIKPDDLKMA